MKNIFTNIDLKLNEIVYKNLYSLNERNLVKSNNGINKKSDKNN